MPLRISCFISYASGWTTEYAQLIDLLQRQLSEKLQYYVRDPPWRFTAEAVGAQFQEAIPQRLCESVCMIALYVPTYESSELCVREYVAMEDIEQARLRVLNPPLDPEYRMIIPIILKKRRGGMLPPWIEQSRNYLDLTKYVTPDKPLMKALDDPECHAKLDDIAATIGEMWRALELNKPDPCENCSPALPTIADRRVLDRWVSRQVFTLPSRQPAT